LLVDLAEPVSTTVLARKHRIAPSTGSAHLAALRDAGLVSSRRIGHSVVYAQTELGVALIYGRAP
jgi:DNA-binding IscR family transcriptional regulator